MFSYYRYPITNALMQKPFPWGELHLSCYAFMPALAAEEAEAVTRAVVALPPPAIEAVEVVEKRGWR